MHRAGCYKCARIRFHVVATVSENIQRLVYHKNIIAKKWFGNLARRAGAPFLVGRRRGLSHQFQKRFRRVAEGAPGGVN